MTVFFCSCQFSARVLISDLPSSYRHILIFRYIVTPLLQHIISSHLKYYLSDNHVNFITPILTNLSYPMRLQPSWQCWNCGYFSWRRFYQWWVPSWVIVPDSSVFYGNFAVRGFFHGIYTIYRTLNTKKTDKNLNNIQSRQLPLVLCPLFWGYLWTINLRKFYNRSESISKWAKNK